MRTEHGRFGRALLRRLEERRLWLELMSLTDTVRDGRPHDLALRRTFYAEQLEQDDDGGRVRPGRDGSQDAALRRLATNERGIDADGGTGPTVLVVNDGDGRANLGARLTSRALKATVRAAVPDATVASLPFAPRRLGRTHAFRAGADVLGDRAVLAQLAAAYGADALAALEAADVVLFQPEGTIDRAIAPERLEALLLPLLVTRALGSRAAVVNGTIPDFADAERADLVRSALDLCSGATFRDSVSAAIWGGRFLADCAFTTRVAVRADGTGDGCLVSTGARNDTARDHAIMAAALEVCDRHGLRPIALTDRAHAFAPFRREIERRGGLLAETASVAEALHLAAGCRLHVGGRLHMTILAAIAHVPSFLFNAGRERNGWLSAFVPSVEFVPYDAPLTEDAVARRMAARAPLPFVPALRSDYVAAVRAAVRGAERP